MSKQKPYFIIYQEILRAPFSPAEFKVFLYLLSLASLPTIHPSYTGISRHIGIDRRRVIRAIQSLKANGFIDVKSGADKHKSNTYTILQSQYIFQVESKIEKSKNTPKTAVNENLEFVN